MKNKFLLLLLSISFCINDAIAQKLFNEQKMDSLITALEENNKAMGSIALSRNGNIIYKKAWGYREISSNTKPDTETKYKIGSITKMFTAVMIFQLIEENKLTLQHKLGAYFPEIQNANEISIEQMLNHHSGLYNFTDSNFLTYYTQPKTQQEMLVILSQQTPDFKPGEKAEYSNTNFLLLGYIIEKITKKSYSENLKERITDKIGLTNTYVGSKIDPKKNEAYSYSYDGNNWIAETEWDMNIPGGAGNIVSTPSDLVKFIEALFGNKLISAASLAQMITIKDKYGMGIFTAPFHEKMLYTHGGKIEEFHSTLYHSPVDNITVATITNGSIYDDNDIVVGAFSIYFDKNYKIPDFKKVFYITLDEAKLFRYEGVYSSKEFPLKITVKKQGNILTAQATGQGDFPLKSVSETEFRFDEGGIKMNFNLEPDGTVKQVYMEQRGRKYLFEKE